MHSSRHSSRYILGTTSIVILNQQTSRFELTITRLSSSLTSAWHDLSAILQHIYTSHTPRIICLSVLFHSCPSILSKDIVNRVATTWSLLPIPSFIQHAVTCLGGTFPPTVFLKRRSRSPQKNCAKAYPFTSASSSVMSVPLASTRSQTTSPFIPFSRSAQRPRLTSSAKHYHPSPALLSMEIAQKFCNDRV
jgi:hypothetical protein